MAVAVDGTAPTAAADTPANPGATSLDFTGLTVGSGGSNYALVATLQFNANLNDPTGVSVTWDNGGANQALTKIVDFITTGASLQPVRLQIWALVNPTAGNKTLHAAWTGQTEASLYALSFTGVDQTGGTTSFPHGTTNQGTSTSASVTITSAVGHYTVSLTSNADNAQNLSSPTQTQNFFDNVNSYDCGSQRAAGAATVTHTWTVSASSDWGAIGVDVLAAATSTPFVNPPDPRTWRVQTAAADLRTVIQPLTVTTLAPVGTPFYTQDFPLPRGQRYGDLRDFGNNLLETTLAPAPVLPTLLPVSDVPGRRVYPVDLRAATTDLIPSTLAALAIVNPFATNDFPVPKGPVYPASLRTYGSFLVEDTVTHVPSMLTDYPVPRGPVYPSSLRTAFSVAGPLLTGGDQFFGPPGMGPAYDWASLPRGRAYPPALREDANTAALLLLLSIAAQAAAYDWSMLPRSREYPAALRTFNLGLAAFYSLTAVAPFAQTDQPLPLSRAYPSELRSRINALNLELLGQDVMFGTPGQPLTPWDSLQVPRGRIYPTLLRTSQVAGQTLYAFKAAWAQYSTVLVGPVAPQPEIK